MDDSNQMQSEIGLRVWGGLMYDHFALPFGVSYMSHGDGGWYVGLHFLCFAVTFNYARGDKTDE